MSSDAESFQALMVELTRAFGWHRPSETPCGKPVPISEAHALLELSRNGNLTQGQLADALKLRKSTISRMVGKLRDRGWVERVRNPEDGRSWRLVLTPAGARTADTLARARETKMNGILQRVPEPDRVALLNSLSTLIGAIHEDPR